MKATVYKSTGSWYVVKNEEGRWLQARMKGVLKLDEITSTNPVAVGDEVEVELETGSEKGAIISSVLPRRNYINRQSPRHKHQQHIVAANLDQSLLVATLREPRTSQGFIDRFLVACEMYHVKALLVFNKSDLYREKEKEKFLQWKEMYEAIGYPVLLASAEKEEGIAELRKHLIGHTTLVSGHSGVGKSTLLNKVMPGLEQKTKEISGWSGKGQHTTTFAEMFDLPGENEENAGRLIDTPGMREFGLVNLSPQELSHYYPEMKDRLQECQFNNCLHLNEPGCKIKEAVVNEEIHPDRFESYLGILATLEEKTY